MGGNGSRLGNICTCANRGPRALRAGGGFGFLARIANSLRHHARQYVAMFAQLYGVPPETLLYSDAELIILRRRVERLRRRFGLPSPPGKRQADAA